MSEIKIAEFSKFPGGRFKKYGPDSGEEFREKRLIPAIKELKEGEKLIIDLSEVYTYAPSFLDEAFSGVIRKKVLSYEDFIKKIDFKADPPNQFFIGMIRKFLEETKKPVH